MFCDYKGVKWTSKKEEDSLALASAAYGPRKNPREPFEGSSETSFIENGDGTNSLIFLLCLFIF